MGREASEVGGGIDERRDGDPNQISTRRGKHDFLERSLVYGAAMAEGTATRYRGVGRPPRDRTRHKYIPRLELVAYQRLERIADRAGLTPAVVAEVAIGHAHGYQSPWTPVISDLGGIDAASLVRLVKTMPAEACWPVGPSRGFSFHLDGEVAALVNANCDDRGLVYAHYLRRFLHQLTDVDLASLREQQIVQGELFNSRGAAS